MSEIISKVPSLSYQEDLWDGADKIFERFKTTTNSLDALQSYLKYQSDVEKKWGTQLQKATLEMGLDSCLDKSNEQLLKYSKTIGESHLKIQNELGVNFNKEIKEYAANLRKVVANHNKNEIKLKKEFQEACQAVKAAEKKDTDEKKLYESLQIQLFQKGDMKPKELQKLQNKVYKSDKSSKKAESDLKVACVKQKQVWTKYYDGLRDIMKQLEDLDRKRCDFTKNLLDKYCNLQQELADTQLKEAQNLYDYFNKIDVEDDIQTFIKQNCSGKQRPPSEQYEEYKISIPNEMKPINNYGNVLQQAKMLLQKKNISFSDVKENSTENSNYESKIESSNWSSQSTQRKVIRTVKALYEYDKKSDEELSLKPDQVINVYEITDDGWWIGECNGAVGIFPSNFTDASEDAHDKVEEAEVVQTTTGGEQQKIATAEALYDYDTSEPGELSLKEGQLIDVYSMGDDGWWTGSVNGKVGVFPSNYTKLKE